MTLRPFINSEVASMTTKRNEEIFKCCFTKIKLYKSFVKHLEVLLGSLKQALQCC